MNFLPDDGRILFIVAHDDDAALMGSSLLAMSCKKKIFTFTFSDAVGGSKQQCLEAYKCVENLEIQGGRLAESLDMDLRVRRSLIEECMQEMASFLPSVLLTNGPSDRHHDHRAVWSIVDQALFHMATWRQVPLPRLVLSGEVIQPMPDPAFVLPAAVSLKAEIMNKFCSDRDDFPWLETNLALNRFRALQFNRHKDAAVEAFHAHQMQADGSR